MAKQLRADIVIGGKTDNSFTQLGDALEKMGGQINGISRQLIDFGKESTSTYIDYEDAMLDAQVALRTQYETTGDLAKVMQQLDKAAMKWASDSRFTTLDVAEAISNAAHAGWDLEKIMAGVPEAMKIALAGGMDLSQGLEYLIDISNAAGMNFDELAGFVDMWAFAANRSSTTIPEMGAAMQKMGATMQFVKGDMAGLGVMLAVLANNGAKGTEAGTLLRNSMIRLIAPTKSAAEAMEGLGLSGDVLDEIYSDSETMAEAAQMLENLGFSAYDSEGNLKGFLDIWQELSRTTAGMTEQDRNKVLSAIFPTRTITGALALLEAASTGYDGLYEALLNGGDYADYAANVMESGLGGSLRHLESVWNTLQTIAGKELSGDVKGMLDSLSGLIDGVIAMPEGAMAGIAGAMEVIAGAGPGLVIAGGAIKAMGLIFGTGTTGKLILAGTAVAAIANALEKMSEVAYEDQFGEMKLDGGTMAGFISSLGNAFDGARSQIAGYNEAIEKAVGSYTDASTGMSESILTKMLTKATLTGTDEAALYALGEQMRTALMAGIEGSFSASETAAALFAAGQTPEEAAQSSGFVADIMALLDTGYQSAIEQAEGLSQQLRAALGSAFADKTLSAEEQANIQAIIDQYNDAMASYTSARNQTEQARALHKAQTLGLAGLNEITAMATASRDGMLTAADEEFWNTYQRVLESGNAAAARGEMINGHAWTDADTQAALDALLYGESGDPYGGYRGITARTNAQYGDFLMRMYGAAIGGSDLSDVFRALAGYADGQITEDEFAEYQRQYNYGQRGDINRTLQTMVQAMGGMEAIQGIADYYSAIGDTDSAAAYANLQAMIAMAQAGAMSSAGNQPYGTMIAALEDIGLGDRAVNLELEPDTSALDAAIEAYDGRTISINLDVISTGVLGILMGRFGGLYAEGGRAATASIFGEDGPEWAIPEEHSQRTADLLSKAAAASGFTWPELLSRNGGLNAGSGSTTLVYSPTINAGDASGVDQLLREDKRRLERWMLERDLVRSVEGYA